VLHLPPGLSDQRREELFKKYGAIRTRTIRKSEKYTITFVEFPTKEHATEIFIRLHQLPVKGRRLSIEFAKRNVSLDDKENSGDDLESSKKEKDLSENKLYFQAFLKKLNTWAPHHIFTQPIPPYLKYKYPSPNRSILLRIAIQMLKEPAFYTQVLLFIFYLFNYI
jgi:U11/U12 small nuclear ribonucleoprotein SNRNP65